MVISPRRPDAALAPGNHLGVHSLRLPPTAPTLTDALIGIRGQTTALHHGHARDASRQLFALPRPLRPGPRLRRTLVGPGLYPLVTSSVTFPDTSTCFGASLEAASMFLSVGPDSPVYLSFTRTPSTVRCTVVSDGTRGNAMALPQRWKNALNEARDLEIAARTSSAT